ncbi:major facilitator superfamily domain-containing protein [Dactylonectria macrodidyma]|uniref:Major facilitator superfamily domain-containing protein n=1 Tax=Dactylonectria macrodidyma TaxID=307937 RepID=A0A9P9J7V2_9HYPO|nr:major facilitator superfamily domain-containing protein [Dactylonectria macrodidyma]
MDADKTLPTAHVENANTLNEPAQREVVGTVKLFEDDGDVVLVPTPSTDPRDPLNLPEWRKIVLVVNVSVFAATATLMASSFGAILPVVEAEYDHDSRTSDLITYPALFIGLGNFIFVPVAHAIGRRPIYLLSLLLLVTCCIWCAFSKSLSSHIAGRNIMSLAAGQAEALCPIMVQEVYFLHERGSKIAWFCAAQVLGTACLTVASSYLATNLGWRWWYGMFGIVNGVCLIAAVFLVPETRYPRSKASIIGAASQDGKDVNDDACHQGLHPVTSRHRPAIDFENYPARTFAYDIALFQNKPRWQDAIDCWKQMGQVSLFPNIFWLVLCSGAFLGIFVIFGAVFAGVLLQPPYNFKPEYLGFLFAGQIIVSMVVVPAQGYLSDFIVKVLSKRNNGVAEPEYRLIPLILPFLVAIISTVIFGQACEHPENWHWSAIAVTFNAEFFGFVGIVVASFTYAIDSYPARSDAALVVLCFARGVISFGVSYGSLEFVQSQGYDGAFNICAIILGVLGALGLPIFFFGKQIRRLTQPWAESGNKHS